MPETGLNSREYRIIRPGGGLSAAARLCLYALVVLSFLLWPESAGFCAKRVVVVVANRVVLADIDNPELKNIGRMIREGAVGLVCPTCAGPKSEYSVVMTAAAGAACLGGTENRAFYGSGEEAGTPVQGLPAGQMFKTGTGYPAPEGSVAFLGLGAALRRNSEPGRSPVFPGALGDALRGAGYRTCLIGNADIPGRPDRAAGVLAMDSRGIIDIGSTLAGYPGTTGGWPRSLNSEVGGLVSAVEIFARSARYTVVSFGDTTRLDELRPDLSERAFAAHRERALRNLDGLIGRLMSSRHLAGTRLVLVSFSPSLQEKWTRLTPVVVWPADRSGTLTSATTRTPGLVAASDFAPTALSMSGLEAPGTMVGRAMYESERRTGAARLAFLRDVDARVSANRVLYMPVLLVMVFVGAGLFTAVGLLSVFSRTVSSRAQGWLEFGLLVSGSWPLGMLLAVFAPAGMAWYVSATVAVAAATAGAARVLGRGRGHLASVMIVFGLTVFTLALDALTGSRLCSFALPGSSQITAMRFYGIGNEYGGIMLSMAACLLLFSAGRVRTWLVPGLGAAVVVLFASGSWGANYGAAVTATVTFGLMWIALARGDFGGRHVLAALAAGFALVFGLAYADLMVSGITASHAGRATGLVQSLGPGYLLSIVFRKALLNLRHMSLDHTAWVVTSFVPFLILWFAGVQGRVLGRLAGDRFAVAGLKAVLVGAGVAFLINDSGIVMSSIMLSITALVLLYSLLGKQEDVECREQ